MTHEQLGKSCSFVQSNDPLVNENLAFCSCGNYTHVSNLCSVFGCTKKAKWRIKDKRYCALHYNQKHRKLVGEIKKPKPPKAPEKPKKRQYRRKSMKDRDINPTLYESGGRYFVQYKCEKEMRRKRRSWGWGTYRTKAEARRLATEFKEKVEREKLKSDARKLNGQLRMIEV